MLRAELKALLMGITILAGCTGAEFQDIGAPYTEHKELIGPLAVPIDTEYDETMSCLASAIGSKRHNARFAVGKVADYTGQSSDTTRPVISQGAALMAISALGKMGLRQVERFDTSVTELEWKYAGQKLLGPSKPIDLSLNQDGATVPYLEVPAGIVPSSDYTIIGGITELDFNIYSTAFDLRAGPVGRLDRVFAISVGVDLRLVDTKTLAVTDTVSIRKQVYGRENQQTLYTNIPILDDARFEISNRERAQEPVQRGVRLVIERAIIDLVADHFKTNPSACLAKSPQAQLAQAARG